MLDGGEVGQIVYVKSKAAITYDVTGTNLKCGDTDIVTATGDLITWIFDGTEWTCTSVHNLSDNYNEHHGD